MAAMSLSTTLRTARAQAIITAAGANAKLKYYNGARPAAGGTPAGTLLATLIAGATIGTAAAGAIDIDEASFTQTNANHVSGTPTFVRLTTSADVFVADIDTGMVFTGTVATGVNVTFNASSFTEGNA